MNYKELTLTTSDNVNIKGWFVYGNSVQNMPGKSDMKYIDSQRPTLVFMHE